MNRLPEVKWTAPKTVRAIDRRVVINVRQAEALLDAVAAQKIPGQPRRSSGPMLRAFFAVMYYGALRPEEAAMLCRPDLQLPKAGWGELLLSETAPIAGAAWTDSGDRRDRRQLKQRAKGEVRHVPSPPPLTVILWEHLDEFGTAGDGRLFRNLAGGEIAESTVARVWDKARRAALTAEDTHRSSLGGRTTSGTLVCPPGSRPACRRLSVLSGPVTPSRCSTRSTRRSSPAWRTPPWSGSRRRSAGRGSHGGATGAINRNRPVTTGQSRTSHDRSGRRLRR